MTKLKCALASAFLLSIAFSAGAQTSYTFDTVTKVEYGSPGVNITGTLVGGGGTSTTVGAPDSSASCEAFYKEMLVTPGRYLLNVTTDLLPPPFPSGSPEPVLVSCSLELKP